MRPANPYAGDSVQPCGRGADDGEALISKEPEALAQLDAFETMARIEAIAQLDARRPDATGESISRRLGATLRARRSRRGRP